MNYVNHFNYNDYYYLAESRQVQINVVKKNNDKLVEFLLLLVY